MESIDYELDKALRQNQFIHKYAIAVDHALLWINTDNQVASFQIFQCVRQDFGRNIRNSLAYCFETCGLVLSEDTQHEHLPFTIKA